MLNTGLVSITFRRQQPREIIKMVCEADLKYIEWSAEPHAAVGELTVARELGEMTRDAGLRIAAYGSYYRVGLDAPKTSEFAKIIETAVALGAPLIRVWAGSRASRSAFDSHWKALLDESRLIADEAAKADIGIAFEFHGNTMNDRADAAEKIVTRVDRPNVTTLWQDDGMVDFESTEMRIARLRNIISHIRVFYWHEGQRRPLAEADSQWQKICDTLVLSTPDHVALLEFVQDDSKRAFMDDANTLKKIVKASNINLKRNQAKQANPKRIT